jgi:hypothetical protein
VVVERPQKAAFVLCVGGYRIATGGGIDCLNSRVARRRSRGGGICRPRAVGGGFGCHWAVGADRPVR